MEGGDAQTKKWVLMLDHGHCDDDDDINDFGGGDDEEVWQSFVVSPEDSVPCQHQQLSAPSTTRIFPIFIRPRSDHSLPMSVTD